MKTSLQALLTNVIDYAGLFPPAELSLDQSIRNYARYRNQPESWMLGRFICPAARLHELAPYVGELFSDGAPLAVAALGRGGKSLSELGDALDADVRDIESFRAAAGDRARVDVLELRAPAGAGVTVESRCPSTFLEVTFPGDYLRPIQFAVGYAASRAWGYKLRTGGVEADAFPPAEQIAFAIISCRELRVPIKFTAGLHHPIRHYNASVDTKMHGFVNVFVAGVLAHAAALDEPEIVSILNDERPDSFTFDDDSLAWRGRAATTQQVAAIRKDRVISFGSCSFDEPRDDLRALGWL